MSERIPVTVIGGYLGAGKTTLVNRVLREAGGERIAVLVNDFGELAIDADLIEAQEGEVLSLAGGCICCAFGSDLMGTLMGLADREPRLDRVLLETSGVALPGSVARSVTLVAALAVDGVVVLADAETVRERAADPYMGDTIARQLEEADLVVLSKTDLVPAAALVELTAWLASIASQVPVVGAVRGEVPREILFGEQARRGTTGALVSGAIRPPVDAAAGYESASFSPAGAIDVAVLASALRDCGVIRAKGVLGDRSGALVTLHVVGARHEVRPYAAGREAGRGLVCIGLRGRLDPARIGQAIEAAAG